MSRQHIIPWWPHHRVSTTTVPADEFMSTIPLQAAHAASEVDDDNRPGAGAGCLIWPAVSVAAVVACVFVAHWLAH